MILSAVCSDIDMKQRILRFLSVVLLAVALTSCGTPVLKKNGTVYVHEKTGVEYYFASSAYTAEVSGEEIARIVRDSGTETPLHEIKGLSSDRYLVTSTGRVLCSDEADIPSLSSLPVSAVKLLSYELNMATSAIVTDSEQVQAIRTACIEGVAFDADQIEPQITHDTYALHFFAAGEYTGLIYSLQYWRCSESVMIYEELSGAAIADPTYPGVPYTVVEENGVSYLRYDFGRDLIYDPVSGTCCAAGDVLASQITG